MVTIRSFSASNLMGGVIRCFLRLARACLRMLFAPVCSQAMPVMFPKRSPSRSSGAKNLCASLPFLYPFRSLSSVVRYRAGLKEVQMLNKLRQADPEDKKHIVRLERTFEHRGHLCLVFESMRFVFPRFPKYPILISL